MKNFKIRQLLTVPSLLNIVGIAIAIAAFYVLASIADFELTFDEENRVFTLEMFDCPSKRMLLEHPETEPYRDYCEHCDILYHKVVEKYGMNYDIDFSRVNEAKCKIVITEK